MNQEYGTSIGSLLSTGCALVCSLLFFGVGALIFWEVGLNVVSVGFIVIGMGATIAILKSSWSRTRITSEGIYKCPLFSRERLVLWTDVQSWSVIQDSETQIARVELVLRNGTRFQVYGFETESVGFECFIADIRRRIGELESGQ